MNRRSALLLTLLGGLVPRGLLAQSTKRTASAKSRTGARALEPVRPKPPRSEEPADDETGGNELDTGEKPQGFAENGHTWRTFDISNYTSLAHSQSAPQNALVEWIFRRTGTSPWHGEKLAVLSASRTQLRAYHNPKVLRQVSEVVDRFTDANSDVLSIHVRFLAAVDTRWRYAVYSRLTPVGSGPQGQQIWMLKMEDSQFVLAQMQLQQGFKLLTDQKYEMVNGQTIKVETLIKRGFTGGMQRESAAGLGYQPRSDQLDEGVTLRLSPLLTYDGDALDAAVELTANTVKALHRTKVIAPREVGPSEITIDVPEVTESRLNQTVANWPLGHTLLISAGIQPGILQSKGGLFNLRIPGTVPTTTELLIFLDAETVGRNRSARG